MAANPGPTLTACVCYGAPDGAVWLKCVELPVGSTLADAVAASHVFEDCRITPDSVAGFGIFGQKKQQETILQDGDRVELYRRLSFDPKESRRRRAAHRKAGILKRKHLKKSRVAYQEYLEKS